jgi:hypothetical protein
MYPIIRKCVKKQAEDGIVTINRGRVDITMTGMNQAQHLVNSHIIVLLENLWRNQGELIRHRNWGVHQFYQGSDRGEGNEWHGLCVFPLNGNVGGDHLRESHHRGTHMAITGDIIGIIIQCVAHLGGGDA